MSEIWLLDDARVMGGGQMFALRLARYVLANRGAPQIRIVCPTGTELAQRATAAGIRVHRFRFPAPWDLPLVLFRGLALHHELKHRDVLVVAGSARCQAVAVAAGLGPRLVHLMHERDSAARASVRLAHRLAGRVVAVGSIAGHAYGSAALRNFLLEEEFERFAAVSAGPGDGTLGVLARLIPEKGVLGLIRELRDIPGWTKLMIAGAAQDAAYAGRIREAADDRVVLLGEIPDPIALLTSIDALVVPSTGKECQPTVIIEALAAGRPAIIRAPIYSEDYAGLPVFPYGDLGATIATALAAAPADRGLVRRRFGAAQALTVLEGGVT